MNRQDELEEGLRALPLCQYEFLPADQVPFSGRVREICRKECPRYHKSWSCPPAVGEWEACRMKALYYRRAFVFSTVAEGVDTENMEALLATRSGHEDVVRQVRAGFERVYGECLTLSSESCQSALTRLPAGIQNGCCPALRVLELWFLCWRSNVGWSFPSAPVL